MDRDLVLGILRALAWPVTILVIALVFRRSIAGMTEKVQSLEAPGVKVILNQGRVEELIREGRQADLPPDEVATRIVRSAEVVDANELRILRALFDEPGGRRMENYRRYYSGAIEGLKRRGLLEDRDGLLRLTDPGWKAAADYLRDAISRGPNR